ncbi:hypothetical protein TNIN_430731 [Trichonephila inaurata madagascariensis]|uniref:Uncharacterized protein n=1 Tax=Trichonephila inaurata madagascariensis TaxID=2747483 RepID=A0A8X6YAV9_9ARAC|nr:hypothetical protein TNIN_430731 [Trichonephila inaurata madagascariensis]
MGRNINLLETVERGRSPRTEEKDGLLSAFQLDRTSRRRKWAWKTKWDALNGRASRGKGYLRNEIIRLHRTEREGEKMGTGTILKPSSKP